MTLPAPATDQGSRAVTRPLLAASLLAALVAGHVLADAAPPDGWWGFVGSRFLGTLERSLLFALVIIALAPVAVRALEQAVVAAARRAQALSEKVEGAVGGVLRDWLGMASMALLAWLLRSRTPYGDGPLTVRNLRLGEWINYKEPLDRALTFALYRLTRAALGWGPVNAIALLSTLAGLGYLAALRRVVRHLGRANRKTGALVGLMLTTGYVQLFFGHVENYSLLAAGTLWMLVLAMECIEDPRRPLWPLGLASGLTFAIHLSAAWLAAVPALTLVFRLRDRPGQVARDLGIAVAVGLAPLLLTAGLLLAHKGTLNGFNLSEFGGGDGRLFVPLGEVTSLFERYTLFSWAHLKAVANQYILMAPAALALLPLCARARLGRTTGLLGLATFSTLAYAFLFNPDMQAAHKIIPGMYPGPLNEWDLFSLAGVPLTLWAGLAADRREVSLLDPVPAAIILASIHLATWLVFNAVGIQ